MSKIRYFTYMFVQKCGRMHPLEKGGHIANIVNAFTGIICTVFSAILLRLALKSNQPAAKPASPLQGGAVVQHWHPNWYLALGLLLLAAGVVLVWRSIQAERRMRWKVIPTTLKTTKHMAQPARLTLPELRPRIIAVRFAHLISVKAMGLETAHEGEPAYDVAIPDVKLGNSVVTFEGKIPRIEGRSTSEWRMLIKHDTGGVSTGNYLQREMMRQGIGEVAVPIHYRDGSGLCYVSHCRLELDASVKGGIAVRTDWEELVSGKSTQDSPSFPATAPRPYLEVEDSIGAAFGKTAFKFTNRGGDVAHNVQVQPLVVDHLTVVFEAIPVIPVGEERSTIPNIPGRGIMQQHDILSLMVREWNQAFENVQLAGKHDIEEWGREIVVTYEDFRGSGFEATMELVVFPLDRTMRDRNAFENPHLQYKTVEVRKTKFRPVP